MTRSSFRILNALALALLLFAVYLNYFAAPPSMATVQHSAAQYVATINASAR